MSYLNAETRTTNGPKKATWNENIDINRGVETGFKPQRRDFMPAEEKIDIDIFKTVFNAMAQSDNLEIMANHLTQLLVAALDIKGCTIFVVNPET